MAPDTTDLLEPPLAPSPQTNEPARAPLVDPSALEIRLSWKPTRVGLFLGGCALVLVFCHLVTVVWHYEFSELPWAFRGLFDLDEEESFGTWFSSGILLLAGLCAMACGRQAKACRRRMVPQWWVLGGGFVLLSLDEVAGMHESVNSVTEMSWAIPGGILAAVVGLAYVPFLLHLPRQTALLCCVGGTIYLGGAVGVELATEGYLHEDQLDTLAYNLTTALEEWMEMTGVIVFVYALLRYLAQDGRVDASLVVRRR